MKPLQGVRILDLTQLLPGPYATLLLAELGAEVIKIEPPHGDPMRQMPPRLDDGQCARFVALNRGKKSVALNLKDEGDREKFLKLAASADAVIEGFRPGVVQRLGVDHDSLKAIRPNLVYCSLTGYGQHGPYRDHVGHDLNYIGVAGALAMTGRKTPVVPGVQVGDLSGGMFAALAVLAALWRCEQTGQGQYLDISMADSVFHWMTLDVAATVATGEGPTPGEGVLNGGYPCYNVYETQDGQWLSVGCLEPKFWAALCRALALEALIPKQYCQGEEREGILRVLRETFLSKPLVVWLAELDATRIPVGPVNGVAAALADPQLGARSLLQAPGVRSPLGFNDAGAEVETAPGLGEHNAELLG